MSPVNIRRATEADVPFLVQNLIMAEASGTDVISYQRLFDLSREALEEMMAALLEEEMDNTELSYQNYVVAEVDGEPVGACAAWVEGKDSAPHHLVNIQMLGYVLGVDKLEAAKDKLEIISEVALERDLDTLQLESFGVVPKHRSKGITRKMIQYQIDRYKQDNPALKHAQISLMTNNLTGVRAYEKSGFQLIKQKHGTHPQLASLLPGTGRIVMQKEI